MPKNNIYQLQYVFKVFALFLLLQATLCVTYTHAISDQNTFDTLIQEFTTMQSGVLKNNIIFDAAHQSNTSMLMSNLHFSTQQEVSLLGSFNLQDSTSPGHGNNQNGRLLTSFNFSSLELLFDAPDKVFISNFGQKGENNISNQAAGGTFNFLSGFIISTNELDISNNTVAGGGIHNASVQNTALGGAVYGHALVLSSLSLMRFSNNMALAGDTSGTGDSFNSAQGGAAHAVQMLTLEAAGGEIRFEQNIAQGGRVFDSASAAYTGLGGAASSPVILFVDDSHITFSHNTAGGAQAESLAQVASSGLGGAIYASSEIMFARGSHASFYENTAQGGDAKDNASVNLSGLGGAIASGLLFDADIESSLHFEGNRAVAGQEYGSAIVTNSGLGGAIYFEGKNFWLSTASFINNSASSPNTGDITSGRGGAIFFDPLDDFGTLPSTQIFMSVPEAGSITFKNNTHTAGLASVKPNSIYFGNTKTGLGDAYYYITMDCQAAGSHIYMYDPMEAQPDNLTDANANTYGNVVTYFDKNSAGVWLLGGHNYFPSSSHWNINDGALRMAASPKDGTPASIDLTHDSSSFTLKNGATLSLEPTTHLHQIKATNITLEAGSLVEVSSTGSYSAAEITRLAPGVMPVLELAVQNSGVLSNESLPVSSTGTFDFGPHKYSYTDLSWNDSGTLLSLTIEDSVVKPELDGSESLAIPSISAFTLPESHIMHAQIGRNFKDIYERQRNRLVNMPDDLPAPPQGGTIIQKLSYSAAVQSNQLDYAVPGSAQTGNTDYRVLFDNPYQPESVLSIHARPYYQKTRYKAVAGQSKFNLSNYGVSAGVDWMKDNGLFAGAMFMAGRPEYDSSPITAEGYVLGGSAHAGTSVAGVLNLGASFSYLHTDYDQHRKVAGSSANAEYSTSSTGAYIELSSRLAMFNTFSFLPFASYSWNRIKIDGYTEEGSMMSLSVDKREQDLRQYRFGLQSDLPFKNSLHMSIAGYLYRNEGDRENTATARFVNDASKAAFLSTAGELEKNGFGLNFATKFIPAESFALELDYSLLAGEHSTTHHGALTMSYSF